MGEVSPFFIPIMFSAKNTANNTISTTVPAVDRVWYSLFSPVTNSCRKVGVNIHPAIIAAEDSIIIIPLGKNSLRLILNGIQITNSAIINAVLAVTEPTALPTAMSALPFAVAAILTIISGMVVAMDTMVAPIINFGIFIASASLQAPATNISPPFIISNNPMPKSIAVSQMGVSAVKKLRIFKIFLLCTKIIDFRFLYDIINTYLYRS